MGKRLPERIKRGFTEKSQIQSRTVTDEVSVFHASQQKDPIVNQYLG